MSRATEGPRRTRRDSWWAATGRRSALLALALSLVTTGGAAFVLYGISWPAKQITMRTGALNSGPSCGGNCQSLALTSMNSWTNSCSPAPDFDWNRSTANCSADVQDFVNCTAWLSVSQCSSGTVTLGYARLWVFSGTNDIAEADVVMNSQCNYATVFDFRTVLSHEYGHVMGLDHSNNSNALMAPFYNQSINAPRTDDCNGARAIYGSVGSNFTLSVSKSGQGTVTSSPSGINCGATCSNSYPQNTVVTLTASPSNGWTFSGWSGNADCSDGQVTMNANKSCTANFAQIPQYQLTISKVGTGTVTSNPAGINCGATCAATFNQGTSVALTATPGSGWTFSGWSGPADCLDGNVTMNAALACTANFARIKYTLTISKSGSGTVTSSPSGINCGPTCSTSFNSATKVTLTATPDPGWTFSGWSGNNDCSDGKVTMNGPRSCTASFSRVYELSVSRSGTGSGTVKSSPGGINCGSDCDEE